MRYETVKALKDEDFKRLTDVSRKMFEKMLAVLQKERGILDVINRLYVGRDIKTYNAEHSYSLPGTLRRSEGSGSTGDQDVDNAHDFAGATLLLEYP